MMKYLPALIFGAAFLSACQDELGQVAYCAEGARWKFYLDFEDSVIRFVDASGESQVASRISKCSPVVKDCFVGYISYIHPFHYNAQVDGKSITKRYLKNGAAADVQIRDKNSTISYIVSKDEEFPRKIEVFFKGGIANGTYRRCGAGTWF